MIFHKYQVVVFRDGRSGSRSLSVPGWLGVLGLAIFLGVFVCNIWLWREWLGARGLEQGLENAERVIAEQRHQTARIAAKMSELGQDLDRIQRFDAKLRLMMNMDKEPSDVGNSESARASLPLHRQELAMRKMQDFIDQLTDSARLEEVRQQDLLRVLRSNKNLLASVPSIWPANGFITSSYGMRVSPFGRGGQLHKGLDISSRAGTPIIAPADGEVKMAALDGAYGNSVEIDHGGGIVTKYAHMQRFVVQPGQWVKRGEVIGYVGSTGRSTGPHLHYEVRLNGAPVNPMRYILE